MFKNVSVKTCVNEYSSLHPAVSLTPCHWLLYGRSGYFNKSKTRFWLLSL